LGLGHRMKKGCFCKVLALTHGEVKRKQGIIRKRALRKKYFTKKEALEKMDKKKRKRDDPFQSRLSPKRRGSTNKKWVQPTIVNESKAPLDSPCQGKNKKNHRKKEPSPPRLNLLKE